MKDMNEPEYQPGDQVKITDILDPQTYTINRCIKSYGEWIYSMVDQGWAQAWAWKAERHIELV